MNSPDSNLKQSGKAPHRRAETWFVFIVSALVLSLILSALLPNSGHKETEGREPAEKKTGEPSPRVIMPRSLSTDPRQWTIIEHNGVAPDPSSTYQLPKSSAMDEYFKDIPTPEKRRSRELADLMSQQGISIVQLKSFLDTWYSKPGGTNEALKIWQKGAVLSRPPNAPSVNPLDRDWAAAFFILLDQSLHEGNEANAIALGSEVFSQGLLPPEIMMFAARKTSASVEKDSHSAEVENAVQKFAELSRSLSVWESALKIASEGSYSRFLEGADQTFYQKQLEHYQAKLQRYNAAVSSFKNSGQESDMTEAKTTANEVLQVLASPRLTWRASDARRIQAKFVRMEGEAVVLEKDDGLQYTVPFTKLAPTSIEMAKRVEHIYSSARTVGTPSQ